MSRALGLVSMGVPIRRGPASGWGLTKLPGAVEYWPLSEASGNARRGHISGALLTENGGAIGTATGRTPNSTAASLTGAGGSLRRATDALVFMPANKAFTLAVRANPAATTANMFAVFCGISGQDYDFQMVSGGASAWHTIVGVGGASGPGMSAATWYDLIMDYDPVSRVARCFMDGILQNSATLAGTNAPWATAGQFAVGADNTGASIWNGQLQDVVISNLATGTSWAIKDRYSYSANAQLTKLILFVGDSIVQGSYLTVPAQQMPYIVGTGLGTPLYVYFGGSVSKPTLYYPNAGVYLSVNAGQSGWTTSNWLSNTSLSDRYIDTNWLRSVMWYACGTNDINGNVTGATVYSNIQTFCSGRKTAGMGKVIVGDILPRTGLTTAQDTERQNCNASLAADFNVATSDPYVFLAKAGVTYADAFVKQSALPGLTYVDGLHPDAPSMAVIAGKISIAVGLV